MRILISATMLAALAAIASANQSTTTQTLNVSPDAITIPQEKTGNVGWSVDGVYLNGTKSEAMDCYGGRINLDFYSAPIDNLQHQFSLGVGYYYGSDSTDGLVTQDVYYPPTSYTILGNVYTTPGEWKQKTVQGTLETELTLIPITFDYALNINLSDRVTFFPSVRIGYAMTESTCNSADVPDSDDSGFLWGVGFGFKVMVTSSAFIQTMVEYNSLNLQDASDSYDTINFSIGLGWKF